MREVSPAALAVDQHFLGIDGHGFHQIAVGHRRRSGWSTGLSMISDLPTVSISLSGDDGAGGCTPRRGIVAGWPAGATCTAHSARGQQCAGKLRLSRGHLFALLVVFVSSELVLGLLGAGDDFHHERLFLFGAAAPSRRPAAARAVRARTRPARLRPARSGMAERGRRQSI